MLKADVTFGVEEIDVFGTVKTVDVCAMADEIYMAIKKLPETELELDAVKAEAGAMNAVLTAHGFPAIESTAAACKFAEEIMFRAIELGKASRRVWTSADEPALPQDFRD